MIRVESRSVEEAERREVLSTVGRRLALKSCRNLKHGNMTPVKNGTEMRCGI